VWLPGPAATRTRLADVTLAALALKDDIALTTWSLLACSVAKEAVRDLRGERPRADKLAAAWPPSGPAGGRCSPYVGGSLVQSGGGGVSPPTLGHARPRLWGDVAPPGPFEGAGGGATRLLSGVGRPGFKPDFVVSLGYTRGDLKPQGLRTARRRAED